MTVWALAAQHQKSVFWSWFRRSLWSLQLVPVSADCCTDTITVVFVVQAEAANSRSAKRVSAFAFICLVQFERTENVKACKRCHECFLGSI